MKKGCCRINIFSKIMGSSEKGDEEKSKAMVSRKLFIRKVVLARVFWIKIVDVFLLIHIWHWSRSSKAFRCVNFAKSWWVLKWTRFTFKNRKGNNLIFRLKFCNDFDWVAQTKFFYYIDVLNRDSSSGIFFYFWFIRIHQKPYFDPKRCMKVQKAQFIGRRETSDKWRWIWVEALIMKSIMHFCFLTE